MIRASFGQASLTRNPGKAETLDTRLRGYDGEALGDLLLTLVSRLTTTNVDFVVCRDVPSRCNNSQREKDKADAYANRSTDSLDPRSRLCSCRPVWRRARSRLHL